MSIKPFIKIIRKLTNKNSLFRKLAVALCDKFGGHEASNDKGYSGGGMMDVWCKYCDGMYSVPVLETEATVIFRDLMNIVEPPPEQ